MIRTLRQILFIPLLLGFLGSLHAAMAAVTPKIAAGADHTVALMSDGTVKAWGKNESGELGDGTHRNSTIPVDVINLNGTVIAIAAGDKHTVALMSDGTVKAWGNNSYGQLGNGTTTSSSTPVDVINLGGTVTAISAGSNYNLALMANGTIKAWGANGNGQLGNGTKTSSSSPVDVINLGGTVIAIAAGDAHTAALMSNGTVKTWGANGNGQLGNGTKTSSSIPVDVIYLGGTVTAIAVEWGHSVALMSNGSVRAWGWNGNGQLGNGTTLDSSTPVDVINLGGTATAVSAGAAHTIALMSNGSVKGWGHNYNGQLGNGTTYDSNRPVDVINLGGTATAISAGLSHTVALRTDGTAMTWGDNYYGQLGNGTTTNSSTPVACLSLISLETLSVTITGNGSVRSMPLTALNCSSGTCSQSFPAGSVVTLVPGASSGYYFDSWSGCEQLAGNVCNVTMSGAKGVTANFVQYPAGAAIATAPGFAHTLALMATGTIKAWGENSFGQLGNVSTMNSSTPVDVSGLSGTVKAISAGEAHSVALMSDGSIKTWGNNFYGQLGTGTTGGYSSYPVAAIGLSGTIAAIAAGGNHSVALLSDGTIKTWGNNIYGQLGNGSTGGYSSTPVDVINLGGPAIAIAAGYYHTVALMADGSVKAWGDNSSGQLGNGTFTNSNTPVSVTGIGGTVTAISAGPVHTVSLMSDGTVKAWGENYAGQLGNGSTGSYSSTPLSASSLSGVAKTIAAGTRHTVALMSDSTVKAWGGNNSGQLGDGTFTDSEMPVTVANLSGTVTSISSGYDHTVALMSDGSVKAWGYNYSGQLGNGTTTNSSTPVASLSPISLETLTVTVTGSGTVHSSTNPATTDINCSGVCSRSYDTDTVVTLFPSALTGSSFNSWTGCDRLLAANACSVTLTSPKSVTASFILTPTPTCSNNYQCGSGSYCSKPDGSCGGTGTCVPWNPGGICFQVVLPVCGCNGVTYSNSCYAANAGVSVAYNGECSINSCYASYQSAIEHGSICWGTNSPSEILYANLLKTVVIGGGAVLKGIVVSNGAVEVNGVTLL